MGITDSLRSAGFKPEANTDGEWEVLKGQYKCEWVTLRKEEARDTVGARYLAEFKAKDTIDGILARPSMYPHFRRSYFLDNTEDIKKLLNDAFTAGVALDTSSDEAFEASFANAIGKDVYVRGWGWTPEKDRSGNVLPEGERRTLQQFVVKQEKNAKPRKAKAGVVPF